MYCSLSCEPWKSIAPIPTLDVSIATKKGSFHHGVYKGSTDTIMYLSVLNASLHLGIHSLSAMVDADCKALSGAVTIAMPTMKVMQVVDSIEEQLDLLATCGQLQVLDVNDFCQGWMDQWHA